MAKGKSQKKQAAAEELLLEKTVETCLSSWKNLTVQERAKYIDDNAHNLAVGDASASLFDPLPGVWPKKIRLSQRNSDDPLSQD